jgi:ABC-type uncharacterized transport system substrate-binding protein
MRRREFFTLLGGVAVAWPHGAGAQQPAMPVIGVLNSVALSGARTTAFGNGLREAGFVNGQNVAVEYYAAEGQPDRLRALVGEFVRRPVAVIVANSVAARVAKDATTIIPIVFTTGSDPVKDGLVASLNRPGGNVTGATFLAGSLGAKRLDLLRQIVPKTTIIGALVNPNTPDTEIERTDLQTAAQSIEQQLLILDVSSTHDIETAFARLVQRGGGALLSGSGAFLFANRERIVALAARHAIPTIYTARETVAAGGLMSYSASMSDAFRQAGVYAGRILKGEKPANLPVMQSTNFEFVINLKTANTLGLEIHPQLLTAANEIIE